MRQHVRAVSSRLCAAQSARALIWVIVALTAFGLPSRLMAAPGGRVGSSYHPSSSSYHPSSSSYHPSSSSGHPSSLRTELHSVGSGFRPSSQRLAMRATHAATRAIGCAQGEDCSEDWDLAIGMTLIAFCVAGIGFVFYRARRPRPLSLVSLLVALDPRGESIKTELTQLARRSARKRAGGLKQLSQRACALLAEYRETFTHAGALDCDSVADSAAFAALSNGLWARDAERADYPGVPTYTLVALLFGVHEPPAPLSGTTRAAVAQYLGALAQLSPQQCEVMWLPSGDRCMTLQELFDRYPELAPLTAQTEARSA
jgi:uncharacterized membrane protein